MKILIMGLPGSGKTTLATELVKLLSNVEWFNADNVRQQYNDWDFSEAGRLRQCNRMSMLANNSPAKYVICDFVAPTYTIRAQFNADVLIFVDTITHSSYEDTNKVFENPNNYTVRVNSKDATFWSDYIFQLITKFE